MSERSAVVPEWTLGWRMQRALAHANLQISEIAAEIGVSRSTVSGWLNGRGAEPRIGYLKLWALRCGVSLDWLISGDEAAASGQQTVYINPSNQDNPAETLGAAA